MSAHAGPEILNDGLVLAYDMGNASKSWRGAPTTNLTPDMSIGAIQAAPTVSFVGIEDGWKKYSLNGTWTAGTYPYSIGVQAPTFTGGVTYSTGVFIKTNVPYKFASLFTGMNYVNEPMNNAGTSFSIPQSDGSIFVGRSGFQYTNTTAQTGYLLSQPIIGQAFTSATDFVFIRQGQIEVGSFPTPFVAGTRTNTQAILDLTNQNTLTSTSLTYASNNTFSFNGTNGFINVTSTPALQFLNRSPYTLEVWVYPRTNITASYPGWINRESNPGTGRDGYNMYHTNIGIAAGSHLVATERFGTGTVTNIGTTYTDSVLFNNWHCFCTTYDGATLRYYRNGSLIGSAASIQNITNTVQAVTIGQRGGVYADAIIPVTKIYNRGLTESEVQQSFNALRGRFGI